MIGYEIINEPWIGNMYEHYKILFSNPKIMKFYNKVHDKIRTQDNDTIVFWEHPLTDTILSAVNETLGTPDFANRTLVSYHVYTVPLGDPATSLFPNTLAGIFF